MPLEFSFLEGLIHFVQFILYIGIFYFVLSQVLFFRKFINFILFKLIGKIILIIFPYPFDISNTVNNYLLICRFLYCSWIFSSNNFCSLLFPSYCLFITYSTRASHLLGRGSTTWTTLPAIVVFLRWKLISQI
jgi:hypothetical protein